MLRREDKVRLAGVFGVIVVLHVAAWGVLVLLVIPRHFALGTQVFGIGLAVTAYTLGLRHAFDADHIAAIDNTTRKLMADGKRPVSVGFWFALGHSTVVLVLAALIAVGAHVVRDTDQRRLRYAPDSRPGQHRGLRAVPLSDRRAQPGGAGRHRADLAVDAARPVRRGRPGGTPGQAGLRQPVPGQADQRRSAGPARCIAVGLLFGLGFDTATEVTLLVLAGSGAASGLPWYAIVVLPLLFAAGMSLLDTVDGTFMNFAYHWAFANPARKVYYNLTITGLSVAVALIIGSIEVVGVLHDDLGFVNPVTTWISGLNLNNVGFLIVGLFVVVWAAAVAYWRLAGLERRWTP